MALTKIIKGDDWKFTGTVLDPQGSPMDITGGTAWVTFKSNLANPDSAAPFQVKVDPIPASDADGTDAVNGVVVLTAQWDTPGTSPPDNSAVPAGTYFYDFQYMHTDGSITTVENGSVIVQDEVTNATS